MIIPDDLCSNTDFLSSQQMSYSYSLPLGRFLWANVSQPLVLQFPNKDWGLASAKVGGSEHTFQIKTHIYIEACIFHSSLTCTSLDAYYTVRAVKGRITEITVSILQMKKLHCRELSDLSRST